MTTEYDDGEIGMTTRMAHYEIQREQAQKLARGTGTGFWETVGSRPADAWEALTHAGLAALGHPVGSPHPLAAQLREWKWSDIIRNAPAVRSGRQVDDVRAALMTDAAPDLLAEVGQTIAESIWTAYAPSFAFARTYRLRDYKPAAVGRAALGPFARPSEAGIISQPEFELTAEQIQLVRYVANIPVSLEALLNNPDVIAQLIEQPLATAVRQMRGAVFAAIVANGNLDDGSPAFDSSRSNVATSTGMDVAGFNSAASLLANLALPGGALLDLPPRHMLVSSAQLGTAQTLIAAMDQSANVAVHSSPAISSGEWYLLADPALAACVGLAVPQDGGPLEIGAPSPSGDVDAVTWKAAVNFGTALVSPLGVRVTS